MMKKLICLFLVIMLITGCSTQKEEIIKENNNILEDSTEKPIVENLEPVEITDQSSFIDKNNQDELGMSDLSDEQLNSVALLNYLAMVSQKIENSKNNRIYLEEVYSSIINNINPIIDKKTQDHVLNMLNIIKDYRQIELKRERLKLLYEQDKANSIKEAMPNPLAVLTIVQSTDWKKLVTSVLYTAVSSYTKYKSANDSLDKQFMIDGWELDDEETDNIHKNRTRTFNYMVEISRDYKLPVNLTLNENAILEFVDAISNDNVSQKLQFLKARKEVYSAFGPYWLETAKCYYELEEYQNCLDSLANYENITSNIFRYDFQYSEFLPMAIVALQSVYEKDLDKYVKEIEKYTDILNSPYQTKWELKYFAAQSYLDLYAKTNNSMYLQKAYEIAKDNVNSLVKEQESLNNTYLNEFKEYTLSSTDIEHLTGKEIKEQKKKLEKLNKSLKEKRKTELPELYTPLVVNCELLYSLANELKIDNKEQNEIRGILANAFIVKPISDKYLFSTNNDYCIEFTEDGLIIPANLLVADATITAKINNETITDFVLEEVKRLDENIESFQACYSSKKIDSVDWKTGDKIVFNISNGDIYDNIAFIYEVKEIKTGFWNWAKGIFGADKVIFECVKQ